MNPTNLHFLYHLPELLLFFLWLFACIVLVTGRLTTRRSPKRGEEKFTMSDDRIVESRTESPAWTLPAIVVLGLVAIGGLAFGWNASSQLDSTQQAVRAQLKTTQASVQQDMSSLKDRRAHDEKSNTDL